MSVETFFFRSNYSLLKGCHSPEEICRFAVERGLRTVALADLNNFYGLIRFLQAAEREGVKPVAAVTVEKEGSDLFTAVVLDRLGYARACQLLTGVLGGPLPDAAEPDAAETDASQPNASEPGASEPDASERNASQPDAAAFDPIADLVERGWEGLAILSERPEVLARLARPARRAGQGSDDGTGTKHAPPPRDLYAKLAQGRPFSGLAKFARERGIPTAAVADAVFLDKEAVQWPALGDERLYPLLRAIDLNVTLKSLPIAERPQVKHRYAGPEALERYFSAVPEALANAEEIFDRASTAGIISSRFVFPAYQGLSEEATFAELRSLCEQGADRRYGGMRPDIRERLDYELAIIREKGFSSYFLVVRNIVQQCPRTCGRGSAASSIVSYLLGITHVDPLRHNLFFERFLNRGRTDPPDIDVDFPWDEREAIQRYVFKAYKGRSGMVANHVTFGPRSSLRDPAKALGLPEEEIGKIIRAFRLGRHEEIPPYLREVAVRLRGFPHNLGTHCGGVVITPGPITDYVHLQTSALGWPLIAWEKDATEDAGLVKIDLLGNRSLAVMRDTLALAVPQLGRGAAAGIGASGRSGAASGAGVAVGVSAVAEARGPNNMRLDWEGFDPLEDPDTRALISRGDTLGVFYVESPATRQLLAKMERGDYENLVIASSIIRPAANRFIRLFLKRLHGAPYLPLHPRIEATLAETYGVMVYQEDVSRVAIDLAGFPIEDADRLRKILSKKDRELTLRDYRQRFFKGGSALGVDEETLTKVWEMILSFDGYSFCKAHSASYAQVSYRCAYLKRFFPLEFLASVINNGGGFYGRQTYLDEVRRLGFPILPPDVNASRWEYTVEAAHVLSAGRLRAGAAVGCDAGDESPWPGPGLRVGLGQLREIRRPFVERLLGERDQRGPFAGFRDFVKRTDPGLLDLRALVRSGSLDSISDGCTRPQLFFRFLNLAREEGLGLVPPIPASVGDYPERMKLLDEVRTLGLVISRHPLALFRKRVERLASRLGLQPLVSSADLSRWRGSRVWIPGVLVTGKEVATAKQEPMIFVSFEDENAVFETVLFPDAFRRFFPLLDSGWAFLVHGKVEEDFGALSITVERLLTLSRAEEDARAEAAAPERPPVFSWWHEGPGAELAEESEAAAGA